MLACGEIEGGIEHLANAVAVCGQPAQLLTVLQKTLPPPIFQILVQRLPMVGQVQKYLQKKKVLAFYKIFFYFVCSFTETSITNSNGGGRCRVDKYKVSLTILK